MEGKGNTGADRRTKRRREKEGDYRRVVGEGAQEVGERRYIRHVRHLAAANGKEGGNGSESLRCYTRVLECHTLHCAGRTSYRPTSHTAVTASRLSIGIYSWLFSVYTSHLLLIRLAATVAHFDLCRLVATVWKFVV